MAEMSDNKSKGFQSKAAQLLKTTYENGDDIQSEDWEGSSVTRVIRDACVHFESEITLPINNDKGNQGINLIFRDALNSFKCALFHVWESIF